MNKETKPEQVEKVEKKPDSAAGLLLQAHLKITDPESGKVLLNTRG